MTDLSIWTPEEWNEHHRVEHLPALGRTTLKDYAELYNQVGMFSQELQEASAILEVGPGLLGYLRDVGPLKRRIAIDVCEASLARCRAEGIEAVRPDEARNLTPRTVQLATCTSVFQHLGRPEMQQVFENVAHLLVPGYCLYFNGIVGWPGYTVARESGSISRPLLEVLEMAHTAGFDLVGVRQVAIADAPLFTYYGCLVRRPS